jgi:2-oxoglutarate ferredoxin oxidoreductase subunit beta
VSARSGEYPTGLIYIEPEREGLLDHLALVDEPLASLPLERVRPPREVLDEVMEGLR